MDDREWFEDRVFADYFVASIKRNPNVPQPKIAGCMDFVSTCELTKAQLCERNGERYAREEIDAMWHGWQLRAKAAGEREGQIAREYNKSMKG